MQQFTYLRPDNKEELLNILSSDQGRILAGGTDILPRLRKGFSIEEKLVDISRIKEFDFIDAKTDEVSIGSLVTYNTIENSSDLQKAAPILGSAASVVGSFQTRQRGTIGGNIGNASPAGDILLPLMALNAEVVLVGKMGERKVALREFISGPGKTDLHRDEVISKITFSKLPVNTKYYFFKQGKRNSMACSVVNIAVIATFSGSMVNDIRIAIGSVAPTPVRCSITENLITNQILNEELIALAAKTTEKEVSPICDVRASANYRNILVRQLVIMGLRSLASN